MSGSESSIVEVDDIVSLRANTFAIEGKASVGEEGVMLPSLYTESGGERGVTVDSGERGGFDFGGDMGVTECGGEMGFGVEMGVTECDEVEATEGGGEMGVAKCGGERGDLAICARIRSRGAWG